MPWPTRSLSAHLTGVQTPLLGILIHPLEVLEARGTAKPRLPKVHVASEEEIARPWPHTTLQQCPHTSPPGPTFRNWLEDPALLPVEPAHLQVDG